MSNKRARRIVSNKYYLALMLCTICLTFFCFVSFLFNHVNIMPYIYEAISYTVILISSGAAMAILIFILVSHRHVHISMKAIDVGVCTTMVIIFIFSFLYYLTLFGVDIKFIVSVLGVVINIILFASSMICLGFTIAIYVVNDRIVSKH